MESQHVFSSLGLYTVQFPLIAQIPMRNARNAEREILQWSNFCDVDEEIILAPWPFESFEYVAPYHIFLNILKESFYSFDRFNRWCHSASVDLNSYFLQYIRTCVERSVCVDSVDFFFLTPLRHMKSFSVKLQKIKLFFMFFFVTKHLHQTIAVGVHR